MIRIGDFGRLVGASVATLRLYDEQDLLKPCFVDPESGYRYYRPDQLLDFHRIGVLQQLGFTLLEIRDVSEMELPKVLAKKLRESQQRMQKERQKIHQLGLQIRIIEGLLKMTTANVKTLTVPEMTVAAIHLEIPTNDQVGPILGAAFGRLYDALVHQGISPTGPCLAVWSSTPDMVTDEVVDVAVPMEVNLAAEGDVRGQALPGLNVASLTHKGPFSEFQACHIVLKEWLALNQARLSGPYREIYHSPPGDEAVTEVQYPFEPISVEKPPNGKDAMHDGVAH
jgi:DNA-binding transcriptional MerR regulator